MPLTNALKFCIIKAENKLGRGWKYDNYNRKAVLQRRKRGWT